MSKYAGKADIASLKDVKKVLDKGHKDPKTHDGLELKVALYDLEGVVNLANQFIDLSAQGPAPAAEVAVPDAPVVAQPSGDPVTYWGPRPLDWPKQHLFRGEAGYPDTGNCFQVCLALLVGVPVEHVPHFYSQYAHAEEANMHMAAWLADNGLMLVTYEWPTVVKGLRDGWFPQHAQGIISGPSPRGDFLHAVLGSVCCGAMDYWAKLHDPHPTSDYIVGDPVSFEMVVKIPRIS